MGTDKAFLRVGRLTLLEHLIATSKKVCETVALVGDKEKLRPYGWVIEDQYSGQGPLAGIHAALRSKSATEVNLLLAVDIPAASPDLLKYLLNVALDSGAVVTVPCCNGFMQPLCAVYRRSFAGIAEQALQAGHNKIDPLFGQVPTTKLSETELSKMGFEPSMFVNVNTPEDWDRMQLRLGAAHR